MKNIQTIFAIVSLSCLALSAQAADQAATSPQWEISGGAVCLVRGGEAVAMAAGGAAGAEQQPGRARVMRLAAKHERRFGCSCGSS